MPCRSSSVGKYTQCAPKQQTHPRPGEGRFRCSTRDTCIGHGCASDSWFMRGRVRDIPAPANDGEITPCARRQPSDTGYLAGRAARRDQFSVGRLGVFLAALETPFSFAPQNCGRARSRPRNLASFGQDIDYEDVLGAFLAALETPFSFAPQNCGRARSGPRNLASSGQESRYEDV
jgi:hypothetical protein